MRTRARIYEKKFRPSWRIGKKGLTYMKPYSGPTHGYVKYFVCDEFCIHSPWGLGACCTSMQKSSICDHPKNNDHNPQWLDGRPSISLNWFWFLSLVMFKMLLKKKHVEITTCMKILYFTIIPYHSIISFERELKM